MFPSLPRASVENSFSLDVISGKVYSAFFHIHTPLLATSGNNSYKICQEFEGSTKETICTVME